MERIATVTVIRGNGACEIFMDGIMREEIEKVNKEIEEMKERHNQELVTIESELEATRGHRNKLLSRKLDILRAGNARNVSWLARLKERIVIIWCQIYGIGVELKLWDYEG